MSVEAAGAASARRLYGSLADDVVVLEPPPNKFDRLNCAVVDVGSMMATTAIRATIARRFIASIFKLVQH